MEYQNIINTNLKVSKIGLGLFRIHEKSEEEAHELISYALDQGINFFDLADIYGKGVAEKYLGSYLCKHQEDRDRMIIQTKVDICLNEVGKNRYDTSYDYLIHATQACLERLQTDHIDILLLHRPDALMDPMEVGKAFDQLYKEGKVSYFGVSNFAPLQIEVLKKHFDLPLVVNQIQFSIVHSCILDSRVFFNMKEDQGINRDGQVLDYCYINDMLVQAWSPLMATWEDGCFIDHPKYQDLNNVLEEKANKYGVCKNAIAIAWILKHPYHIQPIVGTTSIKHLKQILQALDVTLSNQDFYDLYLTENKPLP